MMQSSNEKALNVPAFLNKLWKMVNDPKTDQLISWGLMGTTFVIQNRAQFWYELLPLYYKHNNMSSFVRQLNMYGFHKIASIDTVVEIDKDELHFFHPCFQKNKPEMLKNIKRKVTSHKLGDQANAEQLIKKEDLSKFLADVTQLKGRQQNVDSQLSAMKQENAVLWRELALLRQKHLQQQKIVNKLIQFLVTLVQPPSRMGGLAPKRHYPLMINEKPPKKTKSSKSESGKSDVSEGPIIHELENTEFLQDELLEESEGEQKEAFIQSPGFNRDMVVELLSDTEMPDEIIEEVPTQLTEQPLDLAGKVFLNSQSQDTLLSNLMNGNYNAKSVNDAMTAGTSANTQKTQEETVNNEENKAIATRDRRRLQRLSSVTGNLNFSEDMDLHVEHTQTELDSLKDILNPLLGGVQSVDANAILGLFNDDSPPYGLSYNPEDFPKSDPLMGSSQLTTYEPNLDFSQLFDEDSSDELRLNSDLPIANETLDETGSITTPQINTDAPCFLKKE